jgi:hypothetical protein
MRKPINIKKFVSTSAVALRATGAVVTVAAPNASAAAANGACTKAQRNTRVMQPDGSYLLCTAVGKAFRWKATPPRHGDPCVERAKTFNGALDCVPGPGSPLRWRNRGSVWNPYRSNEPVEFYSLESSKFRAKLTHWNADVKPTGASLSVVEPDTQYLVWRHETTLLSSSRPDNFDRTSEGAITTAYLRTDASRDDQTLRLADTGKPGHQTALTGCPTASINDDAGFPEPVGLKRRLEKLAVGESGADQSCYKFPSGQADNLVIESIGWYSKPGQRGADAISVYFTGNPR